uniref:NADH-ubiquinone oxidoreductase chain 2 n=1 Tax=Lysmata amboinensis TaxID=575568 RepID=A0A7G7WQF0_9EUCA|nr:NADH dehydrogenase subunit 2 [Lysmata amboinensis]QNH68777.1 NADH dehydrogenase subunit 2 [Lysmata amboinensis]
MSLISSPSRVLFFSTTLIGVFLATSSTSWITCWMGLELNLLSFIPIMSSNQNLYKSEAALKYFLIQALGSVIILSSAPTMIVTSNNSPEITIFVAALLKLGAAPLHFWFPAIMQGLPWPQCIMLMTLQKLAPLYLISYLHSSNNLVSFIFWASALSALVGGISGINQTLMRKLLAYSSINHLGWMLASLFCSTPVMFNYFIIYSLMTISVALILNISQMFHINHVISSSFKSSPLKLYLFLSLLSLGGLPPFLGFFPKLLVISVLTTQNNILWVSILLMSALLTLFFYVRITISSVTLLTPKSKFSTKAQPLKSNLPLAFTLVNFIPISGPMLTSPPF